MAIVWPCPLNVDEYAAAGRSVAVPRPSCPVCNGTMTFRSGYERSVRAAGSCARVWVRRAMCPACEVTHALLPSFLFMWRLDVAEAIGDAIDSVCLGRSGVRPVAERLGVPHTTARDWVRRFGQRAAALAAGLAAVVVEVGGVAPALAPQPRRAAVEAIGWLRAAVTARAGPSPGRWALASLVTGGRLLASTTDPPWFVLGSRRLIAPVP